MACDLCPRNCDVDRITEKGYCGEYQNMTVSKYDIHMWEEPPISGTRGSGAIFFTGCNLRCVYCQNYKISQQHVGEEVTVKQLAEIFLQFQDKGVHNINLVTPTHFIPQIVKTLKLVKSVGLSIPVVYNTSGYESVEALKQLDGLIDIYLPDIKYYDELAALKYSGAKNYFDTATKAILEMNRQVGRVWIEDDGIMGRGLIIRHLVLPGLHKDSMRILDWIRESLPSVHVSLMAQYIPSYKAGEFTEINRKITSNEYESVVQHFINIGLTNGFVQDKKAASKQYVPNF